MVFLSAADVKQALPMREAIEAMEEAFVELSCGRAVVPKRMHLAIPELASTALLMPAYAQGYVGLKLVTLCQENPAKGLPLIHALVVLVEAGEGRPVAVLEGSSLTALRTGAASGLATRLLARPDAEVAAVFGAGVQGRTQLEAVCTVRPIRKAYVVDPDREKARAFAAEMTKRLSIPVQVASPGEALAEADVVCTATTSTTPVFLDHQLKEGVHINAIGSYKPHMQEIPEETVCRAKVVVDQREACLAEAGDLIVPLRRGLINPDDIHAELGEIAAGLKEGRSSPEEVTLFKSVGSAIQDLMASVKAFQAARRRGLGTKITMLA
ncbi:ornithine cyclodeaminase family protein [Candidatus Bipolaricaulota bacterium]|nr:ornithine cyclodeaminase family protein [Candidatus Bipolaricaulota bacterium]